MLPTILVDRDCDHIVLIPVETGSQIAPLSVPPTATSMTLTTAPTTTEHDALPTTNNNNNTTAAPTNDTHNTTNVTPSKKHHHKDPKIKIGTLNINGSQKGWLEGALRAID